jgi:hypothetical protein
MQLLLTIRMHQLLISPGLDNAAGLHLADARHLPQPLGRQLAQLEHLRREGDLQLAGVDRADATDHPRAQVPLIVTHSPALISAHGPPPSPALSSVDGDPLDRASQHRDARHLGALHLGTLHLGGPGAGVAGCGR